MLRHFCLSGLQDHGFPTFPFETRQVSLPALFLSPLYPEAYSQTSGGLTLITCRETFKIQNAKLNAKLNDSHAQSIQLKVTLLDLDLPSESRICLADANTINITNNALQCTNNYNRQTFCITAHNDIFDIYFHHDLHNKIRKDSSLPNRGILIYIEGKSK